ncbi:hypothetical protein [Streptomyces chartreusis]|uniref:hypothetical protein n=1 Tax=Streptomyces chartreusis TaxID=1969 RepID=UPI003644D952
MNDFALDEQRLEALRPLAGVIEGAIKDTPIRLGTDDWGTMLAAGILVRVAAYMGGVLPPAAETGDWLMRGTRDLSIPEQAPAVDEDQTLRWARREALLVILTRLQRGRALTEAEAGTLRHHVETEIREADTARAVARSNLRHVKTIVPELEQAQAAIERVRTEAQWISRHYPALHAVNNRIADALDGTEQETPDPEGLHAKLHEATATLRRVRTVIKDWEQRTLPHSQAHRLLTQVRDALAGPRPDGTEQPTT